MAAAAAANVAMPLSVADVVVATDDERRGTVSTSDGSVLASVENIHNLKNCLRKFRVGQSGHCWYSSSSRKSILTYR